jgi:hypothetical protein
MDRTGAEAGVEDTTGAEDPTGAEAGAETRIDVSGSYLFRRSGQRGLDSSILQAGPLL